MSAVTASLRSRFLRGSIGARRNGYLLLGEETLFMFAAGILDAQTLLPSFVTRYSSSLALIALVATVRLGGKLLPQLIAAHLMRSSARKKPWMIGSCVVSRLAIAAIALVLFVAPHAPATIILAVFYVSLAIFAIADCFNGIAWFDIVGKTIPERERPGLFGAMMVGGAVMGLLAGGLVKALFDSPRWPFPRNYALLFALALAALTAGLILLTFLVEPAGDGTPPALAQGQSLQQLCRLLGDDGPLARLLRVQLLLGAPALAAGLYIPYALGTLRLPLDVTGIFVGATAAGAGLGGLLLPQLARRRGSKAVMAVVGIGVILAPLAFAAAGLLPTSLWLREAICAASFACQGVALTGLFMGLNDLLLALAPPGERPLYIALSNTANGTLVPLPLLGGILAQWSGPAAVLWLCPLPAAAGLVLLRGLNNAAAPEQRDSA